MHRTASLGGSEKGRFFVVKNNFTFCILQFEFYCLSLRAIY